MQRFFLHLNNEQGSARDTEGTWAFSVEEACRAARNLAVKIASDEVAYGEREIAITVTVENEHGERVGEVLLSIDTELPRSEMGAAPASGRD